jgi:diguanylate cyclase (GGDEF)-like protein/PAS domain S-box-containing protein
VIALHALMPSVQGMQPAVLACIVCLFSSFTGLSLFERAGANFGLLRRGWLAGSAITLGTGVWASAYLSLLTRQPAAVLPQNLQVTIGCAAIVVACAAIGLSLAIRLRQPGIVIGGTILGAGIAGSGVIGLARLAPPAPASLLPSADHVASGLIAVSLAVLAVSLVRRHHTTWHRIVAAMLLAIAVLLTDLVLVASVAVGPATPVAAILTVHRATLALALCLVILAVLSLGLFGAVLDQALSARAAREAQRLRDSERRFRLLADATFEGIVIHEAGRVVNTNAAFCTLIGLNPRQIVGAEFEMFIPKEFRSRLHRALQNGSYEPEELTLIAANGDRLPIEILQREIDFEGRSTGVIAIRDISERKLAAERIRYLAHHDTLTGLPNRVMLNDLLGARLADLDANGGKVGVLHLDLDRFRTTNEIHGAAVGDRVLRMITDRLHEALRGHDFVARIGNDEYAVILNEIDRPEAAAQIAETLIRSIGRPVDIAGLDIESSTCIGIAIAPDDGTTSEQILRHASLALQKAKEAGKGVFRFFEASMDDRLRARRMLERDLKQAIETRQIEVYYQPLYSSSKSSLVGFEALARWNHPEHGPIAPNDFIPVAEESGLIIPLGQAVLWAACAEAATWAAPLRVAVNLSPSQFRHPGLVDSIRAVLDGTGLEPERLELEVTESVLIEETGHALITMQRLKKMGIRLALDDFGTGYSSLSYLHRFPFDKIKIDRSFVAALEQDSEAMAIVRAVVAMGHSLHMTVTAEGLETHEQLGFLRDLSCDHLQGFLLGKPMAVGSLFDFMEGSQIASALERLPGAA